MNSCLLLAITQPVAQVISLLGQDKLAMSKGVTRLEGFIRRAVGVSPHTGQLRESLNVRANLLVFTHQLGAVRPVNVFTRFVRCVPNNLRQCRAWMVIQRLLLANIVPLVRDSSWLPVITDDYSDACGLHYDM